MPSQSQSMVQLSVIIPCRNEAHMLPHLFAQLAAQLNIAVEVIIADGESSDNTLAIAQEHGAIGCQCPANRGAQMNLGAQQASAEWLLFLHADSQFTDPAQLALALEHMQKQAGAEVCAGHFPLRFIDRPANEKRWRVLEHKTTLNEALTISGDQGCLIQAKQFQQLGGFDSQLPFLEDQILAAKIRQQGRWILLPNALETSARRFQSQGFSGRYFLMTLIMVAQQCGLSDFLDPASLYPEQQRAGRIQLAAHFQRMLGLFTGLGWRKQINFCWLIAALARDNLYQIPLWADAGLGLRRWPLSSLWLRLIQPILGLPGIRQLAQIALLPLFPVFSLTWLLARAIGARIKPSSPLTR